MMSNNPTKRFRYFRLLLVALCLCLSISSVSGAVDMASHNMALGGTMTHASHLDGAHVKHPSEHQNPNQLSQAHNCCDDGQDVCSAASACATHCAASFTQKDSHLCPPVSTSEFDTKAVCADPLALNPVGPFRPPR